AVGEADPAGRDARRGERPARARRCGADGCGGRGRGAAPGGAPRGGTSRRAGALGAPPAAGARRRAPSNTCGVTTLDNALACAEAGADLLGFNFDARSPRCVTPDAARDLVNGLRAALGERCPLLVGVFVNASAEEIAGVIAAAGLDAAQLSGD